MFSKLDTARRVFAEIAKAKPTKLLVISDAARPDKPGEAAKVAATRAIIQHVDWECEVLTHFSDVNLGPPETGYLAASTGRSRRLRRRLFLRRTACQAPPFLGSARSFWIVTVAISGWG